MRIINALLKSRLDQLKGVKLVYLFKRHLEIKEDARPSRALKENALPRAGHCYSIHLVT